MIITKLPKEQKQQVVRRIQDYFLEEREEELGGLAAELLLDFMIKEIGPVIYNQAIKDATRLVGEKMISLDDDLQSMEKPLNR